MRTLCSLALAACAALAQPVSFGVKGGPNLTGWFTVENGRNRFTDESGNFTVGPMFEVRLPCCLSVEVDALYRHYGSTSAGGIGGFETSGNVHAATWEIPALAKYGLRRFGRLRPFAGIGPVYRRVGKQTGAGSCLGSLCGPSEGTRSVTLPKFTSLGFVLATGAELKTVLPRLSAEVRYIRFERDLSNVSGGQLQTNRNQVVLLFGVMF